MEENTISSAGDGAAPVEHASLSVDEGDRAIEKFLSGNAPSKEDHVEAGEARQPGDQNSDEEDDALVITDEDDDSEETAQASAQTATVGDDHMVTLQDGKQISLGELKRNNMFHRDYTFKLDGLKKQANDFVTWQNAEVQRISQYRDQVLAFAQKYVPQAPDRSMLDPQSPNYDFVNYFEQQARYEAAMEELGAINQHKQAQEQAFRQRYEAETAQNRAQELERFYLALPNLRDQAKREEFFQDVRTIIPQVYGLNADEVLALENSGSMRMVHDAIQYRKALQAGKKVAQDLPGKPKLEGRQRSNPQTDRERDVQGRFKALRETGSEAAADRAIEAFLSR